MANLPEFTIYSTQTCPFCKMEKALLDEHQIPHTDIFVDDDEHEREKLVEMTGQRGVPVTVLKYPTGESRYFIGFQQKMVEAAMAGEIVGEATN